MSGKTFGYQGGFDPVFRQINPDMDQVSRRKATSMGDGLLREVEEFINRFCVTATNDNGDIAFDAAGSYTFAGDVTVAGGLAAGTDAWHVDSNGNMWWGSAGSYAAATNKISSLGSVDFTSGTFEGDITGATGTFSGAVEASSIDIGTNAWHVDSAGNMWWGSSSSYAGATNRISSAGHIRFESGTFEGTLSGNSISTSDISIEGSFTIDGATYGGIRYGTTQEDGGIGWRVFNAGSGNTHTREVMIGSGDSHPTVNYDGAMLRMRSYGDDAAATPPALQTATFLTDELALQGRKLVFGVEQGNDYITFNDTSNNMDVVMDGTTRWRLDDTDSSIRGALHIRDTSIGTNATRAFSIDHAEAMDVKRKTTGSGNGIAVFSSNDTNTTQMVVYADGHCDNRLGSWGSLSDERLKELVPYETDPREKLMSVPIFKYRLTHEFNDDGEIVEADSPSEWLLGYGAQSTAAVMPGMVNHGSDISPAWSVKSSVMTGPMLHRAWQLDHQELQDLKAEIAELRAIIGS